jgi:hypothetical protein
MNARELADLRHRVAAQETSLEQPRQSSLRQPVAAEPLRVLLQQAQKLRPDWTRPEQFHIAKSDLVHGIKSLLAAGGVAAPAATTVRPPTPISPPRRAPVAPAISASTPAAPLVIALPSEKFERLLRVITTPTDWPRSGYQARFRRWLDTIDGPSHTIRLTASDVLWIRRQIVNQKNGGWQGHIARVFTDTDERFTGLPVAPRRRRPHRKRLWHARRKQASGG